MIRFAPYNVYGEPDKYSPVIRLTLNQAKKYVVDKNYERGSQGIGYTWIMKFAMLHNDKAICKVKISPYGIIKFGEDLT